MITPFTGNEIYEAAKSMKNGKSSGIDDIHAEHIKYAPPSINSRKYSTNIILNTTAKDGNPPDELKIGILTPLPKPGKRKGPPSWELTSNYTFISIKKITYNLPHETNLGQIKNKNTLGPSSIPRRQKHNRTSFSMKLLAEKAITSSDYKIYNLLQDMSKAFDTVNRNQLFETLEEILLPDEIHLLHILINAVKLKVRVGADYVPEFTTSAG